MKMTMAKMLNAHTSMRPPKVLSASLPLPRVERKLANGRRSGGRGICRRSSGTSHEVGDRALRNTIGWICGFVGSHADSADPSYRTVADEVRLPAVWAGKQEEGGSAPRGPRSPFRYDLLQLRDGLLHAGRDRSRQRSIGEAASLRFAVIDHPVEEADDGLALRRILRGIGDEQPGEAGDGVRLRSRRVGDRDAVVGRESAWRRQPRQQSTPAVVAFRNLPS